MRLLLEFLQDLLTEVEAWISAFLIFFSAAWLLVYVGTLLKAIFHD